MNEKIKYEIYCTGREGEDHSFPAIEARLLEDSLQNLCKKCIEEDDTGWFFELEDADLNYLRKDPRFHMVHIEEGNFGIVLKTINLHIPERNKYLCALRAKRELYGLSIPEMTELVGDGSYKAKETGSRDMKLSEYARYMLALDEYYREKTEK